MKILKITKQEIAQVHKNQLEEYGIMMHRSSPTLLSALTAMRIAKEADRLLPDIVEVSRQKDAVAAISAKKIARHQSFRIVYRVTPNSEVPKVLHNEVAEGVDLWIFPSQRLMDLYPSSIKHKTMLPTTDTGEAVCAPPTDFTAPLTLAWIGDITDNRPLKQLLETLDRLGGSFCLRISGAGVAREVMPAVRQARHLTHADKVTWVGEEYNLAHETGLCHAAVRTAPDITVTEASILRSGRRVLAIDDIPEFLAHPAPADTGSLLSPDRYLQALRDTYVKCMQTH